MKTSIILNSDSYKYSQFNQYPPGTKNVYSYIESRGGPWPDTVFFGLQAFIKEYLLTPVTMEDIDEAEAVIKMHGEPFYREGWEYIVKTHNGYLPVAIRAVPEGTVVPVGNALVTILNTDVNCYWLTSFLETALLRAVWYGTTVATNSYESKKIILRFLEETGDPTTINFKLHDFGARGVSSMESAGIGGAAHLINFMGTDTITGLMFARKYYGADMAGFSIPAMEHSTVTSWGREREVDSYRNMVKRNAVKGGIFACVSDSYDIFEACKMWGTELKQDVLSSGATLVVRPDSGNPSEVVLKCLQILDTYFGHTINNKGYRVLNNVRIIQGDGIDHREINSILFTITLAGYSADNVNFGQGGALLQGVTRDTMKFAMKCSAIYIDKLGWQDVYKDPITDQGKRSKRGLIELVKRDDKFVTIDMLDYSQKFTSTEMELVYCNGKMGVEYTFDQIRANANK